MYFGIFFHLALIICCVLSVEIFIQSNFQSILSSLKNISNKVYRALNTDNISDHWKEKVIPHYAFIIFKSSLKALFVLLIIIFIFLIPTYFNNDFIYYSISLMGITESVLICFIYVKIRNMVFE